jgi:hypothetical protein
MKECISVLIGRATLHNWHLTIPPFALALFNLFECHASNQQDLFNALQGLDYTTIDNDPSRMVGAALLWWKAGEAEDSVTLDSVLQVFRSKVRRSECNLIECTYILQIGHDHRGLPTPGPLPLPGIEPLMALNNSVQKARTWAESKRSQLQERMEDDIKTLAMLQSVQMKVPQGQ